MLRLVQQSLISFSLGSQQFFPRILFLAYYCSLSRLVCTVTLCKQRPQIAGGLVELSLVPVWLRLTFLVCLLYFYLCLLVVVSCCQAVAPNTFDSRCTEEHSSVIPVSGVITYGLEWNGSWRVFQLYLHGLELWQSYTLALSLFACCVTKVKGHLSLTDFDVFITVSGYFCLRREDLWCLRRRRRDNVFWYLIVFSYIFFKLVEPFDLSLRRGRKYACNLKEQSHNSWGKPVLYKQLLTGQKRDNLLLNFQYPNSLVFIDELLDGLWSAPWIFCPAGRDSFWSNPIIDIRAVWCSHNWMLKGF